MPVIKKIYFFALTAAIVGLASLNSGCGVYSFKDVSIPDSIKTIKINIIENRAPYVNPQLAPQLTERLQRKIVGQTKLSRTNSDNAHYDLKATIVDYSVTTSGVSNQQTTQNRLTVTVEVTLTNQLAENAEKKYTISRPFDFSANLSLQAAESSPAFAELIKGLSDDIFNRLFSEW
ncbi:MAG: hypothetical protein JWP69_706 [Flaviaesturariibacter sp.]|nr:hypothetical protein [Flaviaesturariibacter sp.]